MAYLVIKKDGQVLQQLVLDTSKEYIAGRSKDCDIHLDEVTVSRQHFKIFFKENAWHVQTLSKYSPIYLNNEPIDYSQLKQNDFIKVVNYIFLFQESQEMPAVSDETISTVSSKTPLTQSQIRIMEDSEAPQFETQDSADSYETDEKTFVPDGASVNWTVGIPYFIIQSPNSKTKTLRLEGDYWILGREETCDIIIDDVKSSREHCEVYKKNEFYFIIDKGSSNGTLLNGTKLKSKKENPLKSGDHIQIGQYILTFEIRDPHFQEKLSLLPMDKVSAALDSYYPPSMPYSDDAPRQRVVKISARHKRKPLFYGIIGLLALIVVLNFQPESESKKDFASESQKNAPVLTATNPFETLADEQKEYIQKTYSLAQGLYKEGKYELALVEVEKIHSILPDYQDTKEIQKYSKMAIDTILEQQEIQRQEDDQRRLLAQVDTMLDECEKKYKSSLNSSSLDQCLNAVEELDPENSRIPQLKATADQNDTQKEQKLAQKEVYRVQIARRNALFEKADELKKKGKILDAISAHSRNIASVLPDPENLEKKSKQEIEVLQRKIQEDLKKYSREAQQSYTQKNYKVAIQKLEEALKLNPQDSNVKEQHTKYSKELFNIVKNLYGDSVLEENLGNIESAKEKWKKIQTTDVEYGEYFKKSNLKLKKYGS